MATYARVYNRFKYDVMNGVHDLNSAADYEALLVSGHTFNADNDYVSDVSGDECAGTGYARKNLSTKALTLDDTNDRAIWKFDDLTWTGADWGTFDAMIVYLNDGIGDASSPLIAYYYFGTVTTDGNDETIAIDTTEGALQLI